MEAQGNPWREAFSPDLGNRYFLVAHYNALGTSKRRLVDCTNAMSWEQLPEQEQVRDGLHPWTQYGSSVLASDDHDFRLLFLGSHKPQLYSVLSGTDHEFMASVCSVSTILFI